MDKKQLIIFNATNIQKGSIPVWLSHFCSFLFRFHLKDHLPFPSLPSTSLYFPSFLSESIRRSLIQSGGRRVYLRDIGFVGCFFEAMGQKVRATSLSKSYQYKFSQSVLASLSISFLFILKLGIANYPIAWLFIVTSWGTKCYFIVGRWGGTCSLCLLFLV